MDKTEMLKYLFDREYDLDRRRTRALARQQWEQVIEVDARISECRLMRKHLANEPATTTPIS
jgi:hypothetical protein